VAVVVLAVVVVATMAGTLFETVACCCCCCGEAARPREPPPRALSKEVGDTDGVVWLLLGEVAFVSAVSIRDSAGLLLPR
jgi:hypothetical protein